MTTSIQAPTTTLVLTHSPANTTEPPLTSPWPSTYTSRAPWNSYSKLPSQHQPLSPSIVCLGESHHQWPSGSTLNQTNKKSPWAKEDGLSHPVSMATPIQMPPWVATPGDTPSFLHVTHPLFWPTVSKMLEAASMYAFPPRVIPAALSDKLLPLQEKMNMTLEQLLTVRCSRDLCHKELDLKM